VPFWGPFVTEAAWLEEGMDKLEFNLGVHRRVGSGCGCHLLPSWLDWLRRKFGTSFKFVLVWHRTCEKIEATQQTKYSGGWWMTLCADVKGTYEKIEATQKTDYIHRWQMTWSVDLSRTKIMMKWSTWFIFLSDVDGDPSFTRLVIFLQPQMYTSWDCNPFADLRCRWTIVSTSSEHPSDS